MFFFDEWSAIWRTVAIGSLAYVGLVVVIRLSGKRTLAKMNAFDFVVTVAFGSTLATILLSADVALAEGMTALALLAALQFVVAWLSTRVVLVRRAVKAQPSLLLRDGEMLYDVIRRQRVTPEEVRQAVRATGSGSVEEIAAVVLETDGTFSVIPASKLGSASALQDLNESAAQPPSPD